MAHTTIPKLLYGAVKIAAHLGLSERQVYHLHEVENLPTFKIGAKVCAHTDKLDAWLEVQANGGAS